MMKWTGVAILVLWVIVLGIPYLDPILFGKPANVDVESGRSIMWGMYFLLVVAITVVYLAVWCFMLLAHR